MARYNYQQVQQRAAQVSQNLQGPIELSKKTDDAENEDNSLQKDSSYHQTSHTTHRFLYWTGIAFLLVINFLLSMIVLPLLLIMKGYSMYLIVIGMGIMFGVIFDFLIKDLEHLERRHHLFAALIVPLIAIFNLFIINLVSNNVGRILQVKITHSPLIAASTYILAFIGPFAYSLLIKKEIT